MNETEYNEFIKRYDRFKRCNLPTPFWDEKRQTFEYVCFNKHKDYITPKRKELSVYNNLTNALEDIITVGFYYSFTTKLIQCSLEKGKDNVKVSVCHSHAHSFEEVVQALYNSPQSFHISKEEEKYYSEQELKFLKIIQKYLLLIELKDIETIKVKKDRYYNKKHSKYENAIIHRFPNQTIEKIKNEKINFIVIDYYSSFNKCKKFKPKELQSLIIDDEDNFKLFIEYTKEEVKLYKDIKNIYKNKKLKDDDKVIVEYFKVLEEF